VEQYGVEFGNDTLLATGLAQNAVHGCDLAEIFPYSTAWGPDNAAPPPPPTGHGRQPSTGISLLEVFRQISDSPILTPPLPYNPDLDYLEQVKAVVEGERAAEILRISQQWTLAIPNDASDEELDARVEEIIWAAILMTFASGREGREPRLDFFLVHFVTSSLFFKPLFSVLKSARSKVAILRHHVLFFIVFALSRGRPLIRANLVQEWTEKPRPAGWDKALGIIQSDNSSLDSSRKREGYPEGFDWDKILSTITDRASGLGDIKKDEDYNPWPTLIQGALHHPDLHLAKTIRALLYAAREYGQTGPGEVVGAFRPGKAGREETFKGMAQLDGTLFVRAAGVLMNYMGWTVFGEASRGPLWDRSYLGYDEAWANED
jgi:hypothetical protein